MDTNVLSVLVATAISVTGWFVINHQNKKMRKEEAQMEIYYKLFEMTITILNKLTKFNTNTDKKVKELHHIFTKLQQKPNNKDDLVNRWYDILSGMLDDILQECESIDNYLKFLEMGGTNIGSDTPIYQGLKSISIDTNRALFGTTERWINYINFDNMKKTQLDNLVEGTKKDLEYINEFGGCLDDVLIYLYNSYMAQPLGLKCREVKYTQNRRYVTENGLVDKRVK